MSVKWIPNVLTLLRFAAAPVVTFLLVSMFQADTLHMKEAFASAAFTVFALAAATDWLDGYMARKLGALSDFGAKIDLWADKIIVLAVLIGALPFLPFLAIGGLITLTVRDVFVMRLRARRPEVNLKATFLAKSKTAIIMAGMAMAMAGYAFTISAIRQEDPETARLMMIITRAGLSLFVFGCVLSLGTAFQYFQAASATVRPSVD